MPAQLKKIVIAAHCIDFQNLLPDRSNTGLNTGMGCNDLSLPMRSLHLRQCLAVNLAVGIQRQVRQRQPLQRHHVFGQLCFKAGFQLLTQPLPCLGLIFGHHKGHQRLAGGAVLHHHRSFTHAIKLT